MAVRSSKGNFSRQESSHFFRGTSSHYYYHIVVRFRKSEDHEPISEVPGTAPVCMQPSILVELLWNMWKSTCCHSTPSHLKNKIRHLFATCRTNPQVGRRTKRRLVDSTPCVPLERLRKTEAVKPVPKTE